MDQHMENICRGLLLAAFLAGAVDAEAAPPQAQMPQMQMPGKMAEPIRGERLKDLANVGGVRENQLVGYGLVVGLDGTGDQTMQIPFAEQSVQNMLTQMGITYSSTTRPQMKNIAAVMVHASLPPFVKSGQIIDVTVSSVGNAKSLRGGSLIMTPLKGADGKVYAIAQGNVVISGFGGDTKDGSRLAINVQATGRIPSGATVEQEVPSSYGEGDTMTLALRQSDFTTATAVVKAINKAFGQEIAVALDGTSIRVAAPTDPSQRVAFSAALENLEVSPGEAAAKVVVNSRTGTVIIGSNVRVMAAAVTHGNVTVSINEAARVAALGPTGLPTAGVAVPLPGAAAPGTVTVQEEKNRMFLFNPGVALDDIVRAVNGVGVSPGDLVAILQALKEAGALRAELVVI